MRQILLTMLIVGVADVLHAADSSVPKTKHTKNSAMELLFESRTEITKRTGEIYFFQRKPLCLGRKQQLLFPDIVRQRSTKSLGHHEVADTQAAPPATVLVGRADSTTRGADSLHAATRLIGLLDRTVIVKDQMTTVADEKAALATDARGRQKLDLLL